MSLKDLPDDDKPQTGATATTHEMLFEELKRRTRFEEPCCDACMQERFYLLDALKTENAKLEKKIREQECRENVRRIKDIEFRKIEQENTAPKIQMPPSALVDELKREAKEAIVTPFADTTAFGGFTRRTVEADVYEMFFTPMDLKKMIAEATAEESDDIYPDWRNDPHKVSLFKRLFGYLPPKKY